MFWISRCLKSFDNPNFSICQIMVMEVIFWLTNWYNYPTFCNEYWPKLSNAIILITVHLQNLVNHNNAVRCSIVWVENMNVSKVEQLGAPFWTGEKLQFNTVGQFLSGSVIRATSRSVHGQGHCTTSVHLKNLMKWAQPTICYNIVPHIVHLAIAGWWEITSQNWGCNTLKSRKKIECKLSVLWR